ncbi:MAG: GldG family protein [Leptospirillia bacterium]
MDSRRLKVTATRWGILTATVAVLVLVNLIGSFWFARLDLTEDKEFTPSESTRSLLASLDDNVLVRGYFTRDLPPPYNRSRAVLKDLLDEYRVLSDGRVSYEFIDPAEAPGGEQDVLMMGIPKVQVTDVSSDKIEVKNGFMGVAVLYGDKSEVIPVVQGAEGLEYLLTSKIGKATGSGRRKLGLMQGFGIPPMAEEMRQTTQSLIEQYEIVPVDLESGEDLPPDIDALLVVGPTEPLSEWALSRIDGYLAGGGAVGLFAGGVDADISTQVANDLPELFGDLLGGWGVRIGRDLVADSHNLRITVSQQRGMFSIQNLVDYPYLPKLTRLAPDNVVVKDLEGVFLPFPSSVAADSSGEVTWTPMMQSSDLSWQVIAPYDVGPFTPLNPAEFGPDAKGPHTLAVVGEGTFPSVYAGRVVTPPGDDAPADAVPVSAPVPAPGRVMVVGSAGVFTDRYLMSGENLPFLMNAVDWLSRDEVLISLRSRGVTDRPLSEITDTARQSIKALNILGGAAFLIVLGLVRWKMRATRRRQFEGVL